MVDSPIFLWADEVTGWGPSGFDGVYEVFLYEAGPTDSFEGYRLVIGRRDAFLNGVPPIAIGEVILPKGSLNEGLMYGRVAFSFAALVPNIGSVTLAFVLDRPMTSPGVSFNSCGLCNAETSMVSDSGARATLVGSINDTELRSSSSGNVGSGHASGKFSVFVGG